MTIDTVTYGELAADVTDLTSEANMTKNTERLSPDRQLSRQDVECLKEAFKLFDCDSNGRITVEELGKVQTMFSTFLKFQSINSRKTDALFLLFLYTFVFS